MKTFQMIYNPGDSSSILGSIEVKKNRNSKILSGQENLTHLQKLIKVNDISIEKFVDPNLVSKGLVRKFKNEFKIRIKKRKKFFGLF